MSVVEKVSEECGMLSLMVSSFIKWQKDVVKNKTRRYEKISIVVNTTYCPRAKDIAQAPCAGPKPSLWPVHMDSLG